MRLFNRKNKVTKALANVYETLTPSGKFGQERKRRGYSVYTLSQLMAVTARDRTGSLMTGKYEQSLFYLSIDERISIFRLCAPVHAVVTGRMNRISGMPIKVVSEKKDEDRKAEKLKTLHAIYQEYKDAEDMKYVIAKGRIAQLISQDLPDVLPDMSNFNSSMLRWHKRIIGVQTDRCDEIQNWLMEINPVDRWEDFIKKYIFDLMIHGQASIFKEAMNGKIENLYMLPGGSIMPLKDRYVGGATAYVQLISGYEPKVYFSDELSYSTYVPSSARAYGMVPLEALVNKVSESLLFDKLMADQADGTKPPEKMVVIADNSPFGPMGQDAEYKVPIDPDEQSRVETKMNMPKKNAIMTFSGNDVTVVDLSRENTMQIQMQRQKDIREEVAMVYNATNMEMNLSGSDQTSGRSTSEQQAEIMQQRGVLPIIQMIEVKFNRDILPFRFGWGCTLEFETGKSEKDEIALLQQKVQTGLFSVNELRLEELNKDPFPGEQFDVPAGAQQAQPGQDEQNPMFTKQAF